MKIIAKIETDFGSKFGVPRQSGMVPELRGRIVFEKEYRVADALRGLEGFDYIWLLWDFSEAHPFRARIWILSGKYSLKCNKTVEKHTHVATKC